jgi:hypothetical protein
MRPILVVALIAWAEIACPPGLAAQTASAQSWRHCTFVDVSAGDLAAPSSPQRALTGAALGWEVNHRMSIEGSGLWLFPRQDDNGFAAELKLLANLRRPGRVVPFVGAGIGLYHASFDTTNGSLPDFYERRVTPSVVSHRQGFTDPSFVFQGGFNLFTNAHVSIRPDVALRLVTGDSHAYALTAVAAHVTYHFGVHDVE